MTDFDSKSRTRLFVDDLTSSIDLTGATLELGIDGTWYPCEWLGTVVAGKDKAGRDQWTRSGRTTGYFAGPDVTANGATVLAVGRHFTETRVTWTAGDTLVSDSTPIDVKN